MEVPTAASLHALCAWASPLSPRCSLWLFSAFSVLNSEKRNTEDTKNHRQPPRFSDTRQALLGGGRWRRGTAVGSALAEPTAFLGQNEQQDSEN